MKLRAMALALVLGACGPTGEQAKAPENASPDPFALSIEIGRHGVMLSQVHALSADMPGVTAADLVRLIEAFAGAGGNAIVRAVSAGKRGNPVILPRTTFPAVRALSGDVGARQIIETSGLDIIDVEIGPAAHLDVDTPEAIAEAGGVLKG